MFFGLTEVAGYYSGLADGMGALGVLADVITIRPHPFGFAAPQSSASARTVQRWVHRLGLGTRRHGVTRLVLEGPVRVALLVWATFRYDAFVFGFRNTFLAGFDLPLLKLLGKPVVCVFHGSDSRPPYLDGAVNATVDGRTLVKMTKRRRTTVRRIERWADHVVCNPLSAHLHRRPIIIFQVLGVPCAPKGSDVAPRGESAKVQAARTSCRVIHAPSDQVAKGTAIVREIIADFKADGRAIDYVELTGRPNGEVQEELRHCDLVVDQLYSDTSLAGLGTEAAFWGRPTLVGGYGHADLVAILPPSAMPPTAYCSPEGLAEGLAALIDDPAARRALGESAQDFVRERWSPQAVASRFLVLLDGSAPDEWLFRPQDLTYVKGGGMSAAEAARRCAAVVDAAGPTGLGVGDKPQLEAAFLALLSTEAVPSVAN